jgi:glycosyltransferase involved in cell wall biosynthesis
VVAPDRLNLFPPAIKVWDCIPSQQESRERLGLPQEAPILLCVSRFSLDDEIRRRGKTEMILNLVASLAALPPNAVLALLGDGPGREQVEQAAARVSLNGRVRFFGQVEHEETKWFYAACDLFAYPHKVDRPFLAILEAQSCGRPVVTMHTPSAELTVETDRTGLLAKDLADFQFKLLELTEDRSRCAEMGRRARLYIERNHSINTRVSQIESMLGYELQ